MPEGLAGVQRRTLAVVSGTQVLGGLGVGANVAAGGLLAAQIAGSESVAGLASTTTVLGATRGWLPLVLLGMLLTGSATASGLQARYAATDLAAPEHSARALSLVVWSTTIGAVLGPNLAGPGSRVGRALGVPPLAGSYIVAAAAFLGAAALLWALLRPDPLLLARAQDAGSAPVVRGPRLWDRAAEAWEVVRERRDARLGLAAVALGHAAMVAVMVMTPVHMAHAQVSITVIGLVISVHILGMYALSPLVGMASDRFGRHSILIAGAALLLTAATIAGAAHADTSTWIGGGLFLLGLGWSCTLVAGSALLSESVPAPSRQDAQGLSDLAMNLCGAAAGITAGIVVALLSYAWLALLAAAIVLPIGVGAWTAMRSAPDPA